MAVFFLGFIYYFMAEKIFFTHKRIRTLIAYAIISVGVIDNFLHKYRIFQKCC